MKIFVDIDETIAHYDGVVRKYQNAQPIHQNIEKVNRMYDSGHTITMWTARGTETGIDHTELTKKQLSDWGVRYHFLKFGKPSYDLFIDDRNLNATYHWTDSNVSKIIGE